MRETGKALGNRPLLSAARRAYSLILISMSHVTTLLIYFPEVIDLHKAFFGIRQSVPTLLSIMR